MSALIFHVEADKIDTNILDSIKAFFGKQRIHISVEPESAHLMNEKDFVAKIEAATDADYEYRLSSEELKDFIEQSILGVVTDEDKFKKIIPKQPA